MIRFALLAGLLLAPSPARADEKDDLAPFQGTWKVVRAETGGKAVDGIKLQFTFAGTKADYVEGDPATGKKGTGSFKVDAGKTPHQIDLFAEKGEKSPGIYRFEDKNTKLVICFVKGGDRRPKEFKTDDQPGDIMITLEKVEKK